MEKILRTRFGNDKLATMSSRGTLSSILVSFFLVLAGVILLLDKGDGSSVSQAELFQSLRNLQIENARLYKENLRTKRAIEALKEDTEAIEVIARDELGLIKDGEKVFIFEEGDNQAQE